MKSQSWVLRSLVSVVGFGVVLFASPEMDRPAATRTQAQSPATGRVPTIDEYQPKSTLVTPEHQIERARYPFVDIHRRR